MMADKGRPNPWTRVKIEFWKPGPWDAMNRIPYPIRDRLPIGPVLTVRYIRVLRDYAHVHKDRLCR